MCYSDIQVGAKLGESPIQEASWLDEDSHLYPSIGLNGKENFYTIDQFALIVIWLSNPGDWSFWAPMAYFSDKKNSKDSAASKWTYRSVIGGNARDDKHEIESDDELKHQGLQVWSRRNGSWEMLSLSIK